MRAWLKALIKSRSWVFLIIGGYVVLKETFPDVLGMWPDRGALGVGLMVCALLITYHEKRMLDAKYISGKSDK